MRRSPRSAEISQSGDRCVQNAPAVRFARLEPNVIHELDRLDQLEKSSAGHAIYRIWPDPETTDGILLSVGGTYDFKSGKVYNLNADRIIKDHSDICHDEVAYAMFAGLAASKGTSGRSPTLTSMEGTS